MPKSPANQRCPGCKSNARAIDVRTTRTLATEYRCGACNATIVRSGLGTLIMLLGTLLNFALVLFSDKFLSGQPLTLIALMMSAATLIGLGFLLMRPKIKAQDMQPADIRTLQR